MMNARRSHVISSWICFISFLHARALASFLVSPSSRRNGGGCIEKSPGRFSKRIQHDAMQLQPPLPRPFTTSCWSKTRFSSAVVSIRNNSNDLDINLENTTEEEEEEEDYIDIEEEEEEMSTQRRPKQHISNEEKAWRYAKKPLLRVGGKGFSPTHGNSLRQLLDAHTVVKVKFNSNKLGTLEEAFDKLKTLAEESGAERGIELVQCRDSERTVMFGKPGTLERIENGDFPPPTEGR